MSGLWGTFADRLKPRPQEVPGWHPQPKQQIAQELADEVFEVLFGGAAGGGKSYSLRNLAVRDALSLPGAHIGIVRRTLPMLKQTHLNPLITICHGLATLNRSEMFWHFPNGSVIRFISLQHPGDEQNYKSVEFDALYFDEVTELEEVVYIFMLTRLRSGRGHRTHVFCTANPEGRGYVWVRRRWVTPKPQDLSPDWYDEKTKAWRMPEPFKPWRPPLPGQPTKLGRSRVFVPSTLRDNPALMEADPEYELSILAHPDPRMRKALLEGDWNAMSTLPGALWDALVIEKHRVTVVPSVIRRVVSIDPAVTNTETSDHTGIVLVSKAMQQGERGLEEHYYVERDASCRVDADEWARRAVVLAVEHDADLLYESDQGGDAIAELLRAAIKELNIGRPAIRSVRAGSEGSKATRATPVAAKYRTGHVHHVGELDELEEQLTTWVPEVSKKSPDRLDALVHGVRYLERLGRQAAPVKVRMVR